MLLRGLALRHRLVGIFVFQFAERKVAGIGDVDGAGDGIGKAGEQPRHLRRRFEMPLGIDGKPQARFGKRAFLADAGEHVGERPALRRVIGDVVDGDERRVHALAEFGQEAEPARFVAAMIMDAGEERAARRRAGQSREAFGESGSAENRSAAASR